MEFDRRRILAAAVAMLFALGDAGCDRTSPRGEVVASFDFAAGPEGWTAGFADYPAGEEAFHELVGDHRPLPAPLGPAPALFLSGNNHSDDLFMFVWRRFDGLDAGARYDVTFTVTIATDVPRGCGGVGGSPGESVYFKAGAASVAPVATPDGLGTLRLNIDHGNQSQPGANAVVMGTIENTIPCEAGIRTWQLKPFLHPGMPLAVRADPQGAVWLFAGTDSGFEATTSIFVTRFEARLGRS